MFKFFALLARLFTAKSTAVTGHEEPDIVLDAQGWLHGPKVKRLPSVREYALHTTDAEGHPEPTGIVWHYTATKIGTAKSLAKRIQKYRKGKDRAASWHVLIAADGTIYQSVSLERGAWHCGKGRHAVDSAARAFRINRCCIGIELEGFGKEFTEEQIEAATQLTDVIRDAYGISWMHCQLDHSQFDPKRRSDAGKVWLGIRADFISSLRTAEAISEGLSER